MDISVKTESPVGNGKIICCSAFCGIDVDFGNGPSKDILALICYQEFLLTILHKTQIL